MLIGLFGGISGTLMATIPSFSEGMVFIRFLSPEVRQGIGVVGVVAGLIFLYSSGGAFLGWREAIVVTESRVVERANDSMATHSFPGPVDVLVDGDSPVLWLRHGPGTTAIELKRLHPADVARVRSSGS